MSEKKEEVGESVIVETDNYTAIETACWSKFRQMQEEGLNANGFAIKGLLMFKDGACHAIVQPVKISQ